LIGDMVDFLIWFVLGIGVKSGGFSGFEVAMATGGEDAVEP